MHRRVESIVVVVVENDDSGRGTLGTRRELALVKDLVHCIVDCRLFVSQVLLRIGHMIVRLLAHRHVGHLDKAVRVDHRASFRVAMARSRRQKHVLMIGKAARSVRLLRH